MEATVLLMATAMPRNVAETRIDLTATATARPLVLANAPPPERRRAWSGAAENQILQKAVICPSMLATMPSDHDPPPTVTAVFPAVPGVGPEFHLW